MSYGGMTDDERAEVALILAAVYEGNVHRMPERDVRFLLCMVERLDKSVTELDDMLIEARG